MKKLNVLEMETLTGRAYNPQTHASPEFCGALGKTTAGLAIVGGALAFTGFGGLVFGAGAAGLAIFSLIHC